MEIISVFAGFMYVSFAGGMLTMTQSLEDVRKCFSADKFATEAAGIVVEKAEPCYAECSMKIQPLHLNAAGAVMGGAIFTLADFCFAVASNNNNDSGSFVSLSCQISFTGRAKGSVLKGEAKCVKSGRSTCLYTVDVTDDLGNKVAFAVVNGFRTSTSL